jgi:hypothetical protein
MRIDCWPTFPDARASFADPQTLPTWRRCFEVAMGTTKANTKAANATDPSHKKPQLKALGGSQSDAWNNILANQTMQALWLKHSNEDDRDKQIKATAAALVGIAPKDEIESMLAAQLIAAHNAAMECYRRAMLAEQTFEGRRENLGQANKLSRSCAVLLEALNRHRGKGQQKVTVEHVTVNAGGQAIGGFALRIGVPGAWVIARGRSSVWLGAPPPGG